MDVSTDKSDHTSQPNVELLYNAEAHIAEGPFYDHENRQLLWVDIVHHEMSPSCTKDSTINFLNVESGDNRSLKMRGPVSAVIPVAGHSNKLVALIERAICFVDKETGAVDELVVVDSDSPGNRFNDGKCDAVGRLWCGTMGDANPSARKKGSLFSYSAGQLKKHISNISLSNGLDWSLDKKTMYYIDSTPRQLYSFDFDITDGALSSQKTAVDYSCDDSLGLPDGMCIDKSGHLWVAGFFGGAVSCWDPSTAAMLRQVHFPARKITSCCFGGPNYEWLFVTTATMGSGADELAKFPNSGGIFVVKDVGATGMPANCFNSTPV